MNTVVFCEIALLYYVITVLSIITFPFCTVTVFHCIMSVTYWDIRVYYYDITVSYCGIVVPFDDVRVLNVFINIPYFAISVNSCCTVPYCDSTESYFEIM